MGCVLSVLETVLTVVNDAKQQPQQPQQQHQHEPSAAQGGGGAQHSVDPPATATVYGRNSPSPVYKVLPSSAQKYSVRNVYDGDTLTLVDERRVRFLGVDTPELKEQQPFAQEAKDYTWNLCHKKEIFLVTEGEDYYGRLLGWVYVADAGGAYICINEGLIHQGFAYAYTPKKGEQQPFNWDKLLELQSEARTAKRGLWSSFSDDLVVATANGSAYHKRSCSHLSNIRNLTEMKISQATEKGLHPCRTCMG